jgi:hypothetical protein
MQEFSYHYFTEAVKADPEYANLNDVQIDSLHMGTWDNLLSLVAK